MSLAIGVGLVPGMTLAIGVLGHRAIGDMRKVALPRCPWTDLRGFYVPTLAVSPVSSMR